MKISFVSEPGSDDQDLSLLFRWLRSNPKIARDCRVELSGSSPEGKMGGADMINVIVPNAVALGNLCLAYATYRMQYKNKAKAQVQTREGVVVVLSDDPAQAAEAAAAILGAAKGDDNQAD